MDENELGKEPRPTDSEEKWPGYTLLDRPAVAQRLGITVEEIL